MVNMYCIIRKLRLSIKYHEFTSSFHRDQMKDVGMLECRWHYFSGKNKNPDHSSFTNHAVQVRPYTSPCLNEIIPKRVLLGRCSVAEEHEHSSRYNALMSTGLELFHTGDNALTATQPIRSIEITAITLSISSLSRNNNNKNHNPCIILYRVTNGVRHAR